MTYTSLRILPLLWRQLRLAVLLVIISGGLLAQPAPNFSFTDPETGRSHTLSDFRGEVVYLDFWASWCGPCRQSFPFMNELHARYKDQGLRILAVNVDETQADAQRFLDRFPADFQIVYDHKASLPPLYGVEGMPTAYYIDHHGQIQYEKIGFRLGERAATEQRLIEMMQAAGTY
ncbi:TlpA family protein disulfide reductase [Salinispirillum sp. LH 10-3-1]|uniref:TlpA family protein disulfide reductase n=1 Tax=Salinispirillum sp. LH 10-3-1 TaxID=2952525 RepID=A0AB38YDY9_9GAMM